MTFKLVQKRGNLRISYRDDAADFWGFNVLHVFARTVESGLDEPEWQYSVDAVQGLSETQAREHGEALQAIIQCLPDLPRGCNFWASLDLNWETG